MGAQYEEQMEDGMNGPGWTFLRLFLPVSLTNQAKLNPDLAGPWPALQHTIQPPHPPKPLTYAAS
jgi:hypothetical protein